MSVIQIKPEILKLLNAAKKLDATDLENFVQEILVMRARRHAPSFNAEESALMLKINRGLEKSKMLRFKELVAKRQSNRLTDKEYEELLQISDESEEIQAERILSLTKLGLLWNKPVKELMEEFEIKPSSYA